MIEKIEKKIRESNKIIITRHQKPDLDAIGSQIGLRELIKERFPEKKVIAYGADNIDDFAFLGTNEKLKKEEFRDALIISVDTANFTRNEWNSVAVEEYDLDVIKIDHHPDMDSFGDVNLIQDDISSTSEFLYNVFVEELGYNLTPESARALFAGIYGDTGGFTFSNTTSETFRVISRLTRESFSYEDLMTSLRERDLESVRIQGWLFENIKIEDEVGYVLLDHELLTKLGFERRRISGLVNEFWKIKGLRVWTIMVEYADFIRVNLRSKGDIDVSEIASHYDGGGHKNASGAMLKSWDQAGEVIERMKEKVKED